MGVMVVGSRYNRTVESLKLSFSLESVYELKALKQNFA